MLPFFFGLCYLSDLRLLYIQVLCHVKMDFCVSEVFVHAMGPDRFEQGTNLMLEALQKPKLNKQVRFEISFVWQFVDLANSVPA